MDREKILSELVKVDGLHVQRKLLPGTYTLSVEVKDYPSKGQTAPQIVGKLNFWRGRYTTQYPPNIDQMTQNEPILQRLGAVQREVYGILERNGLAYAGLDERIQSLQQEGVQIGAHSRDKRNVEELTAELLREFMPPPPPPRRSS